MQLILAARDGGKVVQFDASQHQSGSVPNNHLNAWIAFDWNEVSDQEESKYVMPCISIMKPNGYLFEMLTGDEIYAPLIKALQTKTKQEKKNALSAYSAIWPG